MQNNISADDLLVFLAVLREGGFRAAAQRLGIAASRVSTTVSRLERKLGTPLMLRTTRSIRATEQGEALAERIIPLFAEIDQACADATGSANHVRGRLKLNVPGAIVPDILPPLLVAYRERYPDVVVEVHVENELVDIVADGCDAGVRYGDALQEGMVSVPIGPRRQEVGLAASPVYLARRGMPGSLEELTRHDAIRYRLPNGSIIPWRLRQGDQAVEVTPFTKLVLGVNALNSGLAYARAGLGIIGMFRNWMEEDLALGTLVAVLPELWPQFDGPRLYYPNRLASPPLRAFIAMCGEPNIDAR
ncbi:LysR family transcriptional regulator [Sphingomonas sp. Leaf10]|uniref:LysR family transcriptional regulator n=1 Tax=Sphingomonas sp. Leaf10 TaxID=1735676 RepID=UPI0006F950FC|nr:LysR family transcriptional regulator [Sphingomonas sp. Leaf10]KQM38828.1 LysR family transcriptional regulator [Sphingomonas sp. Leaf10]